MVYLIGAGPGDPELITVKGQRCLQAAHVVIYDYLANPALLEALPAHVQTIYVGKRHGEHAYSQDEINEMLVSFASQGAQVARLKGGDPFIFGRGGEEAAALAEAGIQFQVVPGVTAATAVAAYAGIPLTQRGMNTSVTFVTGSEDPSKVETQIHWDSLAKANGTIVFFMGVKSLPKICAKLVEAGRDANTPAALIRWGTHPCQQTVSGTLATLATQATEAGITPPALIVVGEVVRMREKINWFESSPLFGNRILVTRAVGQQGTVVAAFNGLGAEVTAVPTLQIVPPDDNGPINTALDNLQHIDWLVLTSANGVKSFFTALAMRGKDMRALGGIKIAVVGNETAKMLAAFAVHPDLVPDKQHAEGLAEALTQTGLNDTGIAGKTILLAQAQKARKVLPEMLAAAGATVIGAPTYNTVPVDADDPSITGLDAKQPFNYVTFTSGATVNNLKAALGDDRFAAVLKGARVAAIGPITAKAATDAGLTVHIQPDTPSIDALVTAVATDAMHSALKSQQGNA
jgi:uroporphyrinogen III methyltransferase/synthase